MRTRDCFGMGTDVGVTDECPCHATFAIDECTWGTNCIDYYTSTINNWWNPTNAHDDDDPGYMEITKCPEDDFPHYKQCRKYIWSKTNF